MSFFFFFFIIFLEENEDLPMVVLVPRGAPSLHLCKLMVSPFTSLYHLSPSHPLAKL